MSSLVDFIVGLSKVKLTVGPGGVEFAPDFVGWQVAHVVDHLIDKRVVECQIPQQVKRVLSRVVLKPGQDKVRVLCWG